MEKGKNIHQGAYLKKLVKLRGLKLETFSRRIGVGRSYIYQCFAKEKIKDEFFVRVGRELGHDFSVDFPKLIPKKLEAIDLGGEEVFGLRTEGELTKVQCDYYRLLEKHGYLLSGAVLGNDIPKLEREAKILMDNILGC